MEYREYNNALNKILDLKSILRQEAFESKGQKKEDAETAIQMMLNVQNILNNLYGGVYED